MAELNRVQLKPFLLKILGSPAGEENQATTFLENGHNSANDQINTFPPLDADNEKLKNENSDFKEDKVDILRDIEAIIGSMEQKQSKQTEMILHTIEHLVGNMTTSHVSRPMSSASSYSATSFDRIDVKSPIVVPIKTGSNTEHSSDVENDVKDFVSRHIQDILPDVAVLVNKELVENNQSENKNVQLNSGFETIERNEENRIESTDTSTIKSEVFNQNIENVQKVVIQSEKSTENQKTESKLLSEQNIVDKVNLVNNQSDSVINVTTTEPSTSTQLNNSNMNPIEKIGDAPTSERNANKQINAAESQSESAVIDSVARPSTSSQINSSNTQSIQKTKATSHQTTDKLNEVQSQIKSASSNLPVKSTTPTQKHVTSNQLNNSDAHPIDVPTPNAMSIEIKNESQSNVAVAEPLKSMSASTSHQTNGLNTQKTRSKAPTLNVNKSIYNMSHKKSSKKRIRELEKLLKQQTMLQKGYLVVESRPDSQSTGYLSDSTVIPEENSISNEETFSLQIIEHDNADNKELNQSISRVSSPQATTSNADADADEKLNNGPHHSELSKDIKNRNYLSELVEDTKNLIQQMKIEIDEDIAMSASEIGDDDDDENDYFDDDDGKLKNKTIFVTFHNVYLSISVSAIDYDFQDENTEEFDENEIDFDDSDGWEDTDDDGSISYDDEELRERFNIDGEQYEVYVHKTSISDESELYVEAQEHFNPETEELIEHESDSGEEIIVKDEQVVNENQVDSENVLNSSADVLPEENNAIQTRDDTIQNDAESATFVSNEPANEVSEENSILNVSNEQLMEHMLEIQQSLQLSSGQSLNIREINRANKISLIESNQVENDESVFENRDIENVDVNQSENDSVHEQVTQNALDNNTIIETNTETPETQENEIVVDSDSVVEILHENQLNQNSNENEIQSIADDTELIPSENEFVHEQEQSIPLNEALQTPNNITNESYQSNNEQTVIDTNEINTVDDETEANQSANENDNENEIQSEDISISEKNGSHANDTASEVEELSNDISYASTSPSEAANNNISHSSETSNVSEKLIESYQYVKTTLPVITQCNQSSINVMQLKKSDPNKIQSKNKIPVRRPSFSEPSASIKNIQNELMNKAKLPPKIVGKKPSKIVPPKVFFKSALSSLANKAGDFIQNKSNTKSPQPGTSRASTSYEQPKIPKKKYFETCFSDDYQTSDDEKPITSKKVIPNLVKIAESKNEESFDVEVSNYS